MMKFICKSHGPYEVSGNEHLVCKLFQALYIFKQAPLQWFQKVDNVFEQKHNHLMAICITFVRMKRQ
jgi:hypothetical protein